MKNHMAAGWFYSPSQIGRYILTRFTSLKPPRVSSLSPISGLVFQLKNSQNKIRSPIAVLRELTTHQWLMFLVGFLGWTWDSFDFFTVSMTVTEIAKDLDVSVTSVTWVSRVLFHLPFKQVTDICCSSVRVSPSR